jgi:hypothetical protein
LSATFESPFETRFHVEERLAATSNPATGRSKSRASFLVSPRGKDLKSILAADNRGISETPEALSSMRTMDSETNSKRASAAEVLVVLTIAAISPPSDLKRQVTTIVSDVSLVRQPLIDSPDQTPRPVSLFTARRRASD